MVNGSEPVERDEFIARILFMPEHTESLDANQGPGGVLPALPALMLLLGIIVAVACHSVRVNDGLLIYSQDDPYIHMAIARNLVDHGVWGVTAEGFASASSSPLWTALLAGLYGLFGDSTLLPFALNVVGALAIVVIARATLRRRLFSEGSLAAALVLVVVLAALPAIVFTGMEHSAHCALTLAFADLAACALSDERRARGGRSVALFVTAALMVAFRYEGLFIAVGVAALLALRRRFRDALVLLAAAAAPVVIFGLWSISMDAWFLPNSVLLKGRQAYVGSFEALVDVAVNTLRGFIRTPHLLILFVIGLDLLVLLHGREHSPWRYPKLLLGLALFSILMHEQFAGTLYRYLTYLIVLGSVAIMVALRELAAGEQGKMGEGRSIVRYAVAVATLAFVGIGVRSGFLLLNTSLATTNIYGQQYQIARFIREFYHDAEIGLNDIGAVSYLADPHILDLYGLADMEVARAKREGQYTTEMILELGRRRNLKLAIAYDGWYINYGGLPREWIVVGQWRIPDNVACGADVVTIYAVDSTERDALVHNLQSFSLRLPRSVIQSGMYVDAMTRAGSFLPSDSLLSR